MNLSLAAIFLLLALAALVLESREEVGTVVTVVVPGAVVQQGSRVSG